MSFETVYPRVDAFARAIMERVPKRGDILEIGCGEGQLTTILRDAGYNVTPLDPKERASALLRLHRNPAGSAHVDDLTAFLQKARRLLKSTGALPSTTMDGSVHRMTLRKNGATTGATSIHRKQCWKNYAGYSYK